MKKHLIAAAVAGAFAVPAMAQVTVSGTLDLGVGSQKTTGQTNTIKRSNTGVADRSTTSQLVFRAQEDLGGGLRASALISQSLNSSGNVATGILGNRDMFLELSGGFGGLRLGRFTPAFETVSGRYAVTGTANSAGTVDFFFGASTVAGAAAAGPRVAYTDVGRGLGAGSTATNDWNTSVQYTLPAFGPVSVVVGYADHSSDTNATTGKLENNQIDLAVTYTAGPLSFGAAMADRKVQAEGSAATTKSELRSVGASYNLGVASVKVGHMTRDQKASNEATKAVDANITSVGVSVPLGATTIYADVLDGEDKAGGVAADKRDFDGFQVGALYNLSKRTTAYFIMGENKYKGSTTATTSKIETVTLGLRHSF